MDAESNGGNFAPVRHFTSITTVVDNRNSRESMIPPAPAPSFMPFFIENSRAPSSTMLSLPPPVCSWTPIMPSAWPFASTSENANYTPSFYVNDAYAQPEPVEWYEYDLSSHSYEFGDPEKENVEAELDNEFGQMPMASDWEDLQDWAFDLVAEDDDDHDYPSKRLQRLAWNAFRGVRTESVIQDRLQSHTQAAADVDVWENLSENRFDEQQPAEIATQLDESTMFQRPNENVDSERAPVENDGNEEIKITIPDSLLPIPCCETLLVIPDTPENAPPVPVSYAAASTPRNTSEIIAAHLNRVVKMHLIAANTPVTEPFPCRHEDTKIPVSSAIHASSAEANIPKDPISPIILQHANSLDGVAALARRNSSMFRQINGGLLLIPFPQEEHRYCIGSGTAGRMVIGLERLAPPRLYAHDFRTICLKKVPHTEDCDKVWCRLNLFRKQICAQKSAARRNNVAIYELFARQDQFAYFGRLPYKWNLDEYLKSEQYANNITDAELEGLRILRGIANGLAYVHRGDFRLFHGNLKPSNVLVSSDGSVFLTDYGFGRICCPMWSGAAAYRFCRDPETDTFDPLCWKAYDFFSGYGNTIIAAQTPPSLSRETPHRQADVFSAALLGYYAATGGRSHPLIDGEEAYRKTLYYYRQRVDRFSDFVQLDAITDPVSRRLVSSMLDTDIKQRPDARYVADHPAFWNEKKRNDFLLAVAEFVCAGEKLAPNGNAGTQAQANSLIRALTPKKVASFGFARGLNWTPDNVAKIAARFGVKFEDASATTALKTFYRRNRRIANVGDKPTCADELDPLWNELAAEIYDVVYPAPPLKLKQFFTK